MSDNDNKKQSLLFKLLFAVIGMQFLFGLGYFLYVLIGDSQVDPNTLVFASVFTLLVLANIAVIKKVIKDHKENKK